MTVETHNISAADHALIKAAIGAAEKKTSGEVFAVVAQQSDDYFFVSGFFAGLWAVGFGLVLSVFAIWFEYPMTALTLAVGQAVSYGIWLLIFANFPGIRLMFVPNSIAYRRASSNAARQFLAHGIHNTEGRSGVLLFVSLAERYAEVVADSGINERVDQGEWNTMVATLVSHARADDLGRGFVIAVEHAGNLLAQHFPPIKGKANELDDKLIEI